MPGRLNIVKYPWQKIHEQVIWDTIYCCSVAKLCPTVCYPMDCSMTGFPVLQYLLKFSQTHVHWVSDAIKPFHPPSLTSPPALNRFQNQGLFQRVGCLHHVARVFGASASASVLLMSIQGWFPLGLIGVISLQSEGTLKSLLQHYSLKASILWHSAFFIIQYSHPYMTTGKIIALICGPLLAK